MRLPGDRVFCDQGSRNCQRPQGKKTFGKGRRVVAAEVRSVLWRQRFGWVETCVLDTIANAKKLVKRLIMMKADLSFFP